MLWNADKAYLRELAARGIRVPPTRWSEPDVRPDTHAFLRETGEHRAVLKPRVSATAYGTYVLLRADPSPVIELNRAAAVAMRDGPAAGLALVDALLARGELAGYHLAHSARADLCRRLGRTEEARDSYQRALALARQEPERRFLGRRLAELGSGVSPP